MEQTVQKQQVAVYCRVATDSEDHSASLAVQEAYYTEMVGQHPEWELAGIYADKGIAGTDRQNQKEFKKMLIACKQGKIDLILTKSLSRLARNTVDSLEVVRMLRANCIGVIFEKENINTLTDDVCCKRCISNASNTTYSQLICGTNEMADERTATDGRIELYQSWRLLYPQFGTSPRTIRTA